MSKSIKAIILVSIGLIIWTILVYAAIAFFIIEVNPFKWVQEARGVMLFMMLMYLFLCPLITICIEDLLKPNK